MWVGRVIARNHHKNKRTRAKQLTCEGGDAVLQTGRIGETQVFLKGGTVANAWEFALSDAPQVKHLDRLNKSLKPLPNGHHRLSAFAFAQSFEPKASSSERQILCQARCCTEPTGPSCSAGSTGAAPKLLGLGRVATFAAVLLAPSAPLSHEQRQMRKSKQAMSNFSL